MDLVVPLPPHGNYLNARQRKPCSLASDPRHKTGIPRVSRPVRRHQGIQRSNRRRTRRNPSELVQGTVLSCQSWSHQAPRCCRISGSVCLGRGCTDLQIESSIEQSVFDKIRGCKTEKSLDYGNSWRSIKISRCGHVGLETTRYLC
jgi:hypothetical protein